MKKEISTPVMVAVVVVVLLLVLGVGWYAINRDPPLRNVPGSGAAQQPVPGNAGKRNPATGPMVDVP